MTQPARGILERLDRLERQVRLWRVCVTIACSLLLGVFLMGQAAPQSEAITSNLFVLRGSSGEASAKLVAGSDGPHLQFFNPGGEQKRTLVADLGVDRFGSPSLAFWDEDGRARAELRLTDDGSPSLTLRDRNVARSITLRAGGGQPVRAVTARGVMIHGGGSPSLEIRDYNGTPSLVLGEYEVGPDPEKTAQASGQVGVPITTFSYGPSSLVLFDRDGTRTLSLSGYGARSLAITDKDGKSLCSGP